MNKWHKKQELTIVGEIKAKEEKPLPAPIVPELTFDAWWINSWQSKKLRPELKEVIKRHFKSKGFLDNKDFDKGLRDFGIE